MLIEFSVTNFKSIHKTQTLSLAASNATELQENNCITTSEKGMPRLLRSVVIYGPNASGKSNLLEAIEFMETFVIQSAKEGQEGESIQVTPFLLNIETRTKPSEFEVLFVQDEIRFQYGFAVNQIRVTHEWLIAYPEGRPQRWFEREYDTDSNKYKWYFGSKFKGYKNILKEQTRENALFLSTAIQLNNEQLKPVYNWFQNKLRTIGIGGMSPTYSASVCKDNETRKRILEFLKAADLSIEDLQIEMKKFDLSELSSDMPEPLKTLIHKELDGKERPEVLFLHQVAGSDELLPFNSENESVGTRKLFSLAGPWLDVLNKGYVLFVDELDNSMHPMIVRFLVSLINNRGKNAKNAQLIFTTHDTSILDNEIFRRDQIWFTEKDTNNATHLYPLSDFTPRKGEALEKGYLNGRYGALPYIGELSF